MRHFVLSPGFHNDTNAAKQLLQHYIESGHSDLLTEEMILGIGGGIGYGYFTFYYEKEDFTNFHLGTRAGWEDSAGFISGIFRSLGIPLEQKQTKNKDAALKLISNYSEQGRPSIIPVHHGIFENCSLQENGYPIYCIVYGLERETGTAKLAFRYSDGITISIEQLMEGRSRLSTAKLVNQALFIPDASYEEAAKVTMETIIAASKQGIERCLAHAHSTRMANFGISALYKWETRLTAGDKQSWIRLFEAPKHWSKALYSTVRHIVHNTDGSAFRPAYAAFLNQVGTLIDEPLLNECGERFEKTGALWRQLADLALPDEADAAKALKALIIDTEQLIRNGGMQHADYVQRLDGMSKQRKEMEQAADWKTEQKKEHFMAMSRIVGQIAAQEKEALDVLQAALQSARWA
ncbi:DUF4872 domain-containing protein [Paenibacillus prosopidis]|uniref:Butirosin biosynthesis protein H-like n=1 Tax=Paenibacillus prosopidis TaxID=630520 RepID=A0A368VZD0_9BACL|nr:DUF4872 domain-containing protein [Paenibacillus prosopidis]RCW44969.1 butirosin biosynthesis protein H-like [Paenibacillus prosopidis]